MIASATAIGQLWRREAEAWRPRPRPSTADWCQANLRLPVETSSSPGRYDLRRFPYWRGVLDAVDDLETEQISIMAATQCGKTTFLQAVLASLPFVSPAPAMLAAPDRDACRELRDKFYKMCEVTPVIARLIPPAWKRNDQAIDFGNLLCQLAWSGNTQRLSGKSCRYVLCTEIDRWKQDPHEGATQRLIAERVKAFFHFLIIYESTPTDETSAIADLYDASDQRHFLVPCPHCGRYQELRFFPHKEGAHAGRGGVAGLQREGGEWLTAEEAREAAYYVCERGCRIESEEKPAMVALGVWCPKGQTVLDKDDKDEQGRLKGKPDRPPRHAGFQLSSLYAETVDFGRMAAAYLESRDRIPTLRTWWNNWLGLRWQSKAKAPKWQRVGRRLAGSHRRGVVPAQAFFLTAGEDTQDDCVYCAIRAWGEGSTSWLVDERRFGQRLNEDGQTIPGSDLDQLDEFVLDRVFPLVGPNPIGLTKMRVRLLCMDYQGHRSWEVFNWVRSRAAKGINRIRIVAGDSRVPAGQMYAMSVVERHAGSGKKYPGGLERWAIDTAAYKSEIHRRFEAPLDSPGAWFLYEDIIHQDEDYLRQICNETRKPGKTTRGGEIWEMVDERIGNHQFDDEVYAMAAADMVTGRDWIDLLRRAGPVQQPAGGDETPRRSSRRPKQAATPRPLPYGRERE